MLRIAYLVNQYPKGSHTFIRREIHALEARGIQVLRISLRGWDADLVDADDRREREITHYVLRDGVLALAWGLARTVLQRPVAVFKALLLALRMSRRADRPLPYHLAYLCEACCLLAPLRAFRAQHVHAHFGTNSAEVAMLVRALGGPTFSFTAHGPDEFDRPEFLGLAEKIRRCAFVVAVSSFGRSQLYRWSDHADWPKVKVVHCGVDAAFARASVSAPPAAARIVCVGRISAQKGQLLLVEAAARLVRQGRTLEVVLVGDGELRAQVEDLVRRHSLAGAVRITGWLSGEAVRKEIVAARVLALPSFAEGLPVGIMEAMALCRPVIATQIAGIPELVTPRTGWLVPAGDVESLTRALDDCLSRPEHELAAMGAAARERALERHSSETEAAKLAAHFAEHCA